MQYNNIQEEKNYLNKKFMYVFAAGGALEYFDFSLFAYTATIIAMHFFPNSSHSAGMVKSFGIFASGYLARFLGGLIFSHYGDTRGRKTSFTWTIFLMACPSMGIALLPGYYVLGIMAPILLTLFRIAQGLAMGGEAPCAMCFVHESAPSGSKAFAMGLLLGGVIVGAIFANVVCQYLQIFMGKTAFEAWGWRLPYLLSFLLGVFGFILRKNVKESSEFLKFKMLSMNNPFPLKTIFNKHKKFLFVGFPMLLPPATAFFFYMIISKSLFPFFYHLSADFTEKLMMISLISNALFSVIFGYICDKVGAKKIYFSGIIGIAILCLPLHFLLLNEHHFQHGIIESGFLLNSIFMGACAGSLFHILASAFPVDVRNSGVSFMFNMSNGVFLPFIAVLFSKLSSGAYLSIVPYCVLIFLCLLAVVSFMSLFYFRKEKILV